MNDLQSKIDLARKKGYSDSQIQTFLKSKGIDPSLVKPTISAQIGQDAIKRGDAVVKSVTDIGQSKNPVEAIARTAQVPLKAVGSVAGFANDVIGAGVAPILEKTGLDKPLGAAVKAVADTKTAKDIKAGYDLIPAEVKSALGDTANIAGFAPIGVGASVATKGALKAGEVVFDVAKNTKPIAALRGGIEPMVQKSINNDVKGLLNATRGISKQVQNAEARGADLSATLSDPSVFRGIKVQSGKINPDDAVAVIDDRIGRVMDAKHEMLPKIDKLVPETPRDVLRQRAIEDIKGKFTPADETSLIEAINKQVDAIPETLKPSDIDSLRAKFRASARNAKGLQKSSSEYAALENAARDTVFDITDNLPVSGAEEYKALNNYVKNMITTKEFLDETLRGQIVKGGRLRGYAMRTIGAIAGTSHGPLGAIAGSEVGGLVADVITNNQLGSAVKMSLIKNITNDPEIIAQAQKLLGDIKDLNVPQLPPASGEFRSKTVGPKTIDLGSKTQSTIDAQERGNLNISRQNTAKSTITMDPETTIGDKPTIPSTKKQPLNKGAAINPAYSPKFHLDDLREMKDFTDYVAGDYKPTPAQAHALEVSATRIWEKYLPNKKMPKTLKGMANEYGKWLEKNQAKLDADAKKVMPQDRKPNGEFDNK